MIRQDWSTMKKLMFAKTAADGAAAVEATATGNPLTFLTDLAKPLKSLLIPFTPIQEGSGDPSPVNVRPIVPWDGLTVKRGEKNLFSSAVEQGGLTTATDGSAINPPSSKRVRTEDYILLGNGTYTISSSVSSYVVICVYDENKTYLIDESLRSWASLPRTFTITGNRYIKCMLRKADENAEILPSYLENLQLEVGSSATAYEPYKPITSTDFVFPSPVYGGTLDVVSGVLTVTHGFVTIDGTETFTDVSSAYATYADDNKFSVFVKSMASNSFCDRYKCVSASTTAGLSDAECAKPSDATSRLYFKDSTLAGKTADELKTYFASNPFHACLELKTPLTVQLTPQQINAIKGNNTIWSDADGSMTAIYLKKG